MDARSYLQSFGWQEGEALQQGGLRKPLLVEHKRDTKGLGHNEKDGETWWESLFDGHLKNLEVSTSTTGTSFAIDNDKVDASVRKRTSPLYKMFVQGEGLAGTVGQPPAKEDSVKIDPQEVFEKQTKGLRKEKKRSSKEEKKNKSKEKKDKVEKKEKKEKTKKDKVEKPKKEKSKEKKPKKEKSKEKKEKKEKKDKSEDKSKDKSKEKTDKSKEPKKEKDSKKRKLDSSIPSSKKHKS